MNNISLYMYVHVISTCTVSSQSSPSYIIYCAHDSVAFIVLFSSSSLSVHVHAHVGQSDECEHRKDTAEARRDKTSPR